jgi:DNA-binding NtrC family response regulator
VKRYDSTLVREDRTVRTLRDASGQRSPATPEQDVLYVALCGDDPLAGTLAIALVPGEILVIGRGGRLDLEEKQGDGEIWLRVPDARVSERHAIIERRGEALEIEDLGSLNGTFIAGEPIRKASIDDRSLVVVGRTVLWFRRRIHDPRLGPPLEIPGAPELRTLSPEAAHAHDMLARAAPSDLPVLLRGETGTGKEIAARALHALSGRAGRFVAVNCGALPENLVESELFGYRRGAFSGATQDKTGLIAAATSGTILLDEIGELPLPAQVKLLRALQEREILPLGATHGEAIKIDFRLVSATNADLEALTARGRFRADLFARIRGLAIELPPLRARRMDLGLLVGALLVRLAGEAGRSYRFDRRCAEALVAYDYPNNIRELEQALKTLLALAGNDHLFRVEALATTALGQAPAAPARPHRDSDGTRAQLLEQLARHQGNISAVARGMQCTRMQVHRWLKRWDIDAKPFRRET